jgi:hypothetical protein
MREEKYMIINGKLARRGVLASAISAAIAFCTSVPASASTTAPGNIVGVLPHAAGVLLFNHTGTRTGRPACSTVDRWAVSTTTPAGQAMASALLTAWSLHKQITVIGSGACDIWGDTESVSYFVISD